MKLLTSQRDRRWMGLPPGDGDMKVVELPADVVASHVLMWLEDMTDYKHIDGRRHPGWFIAYQLASIVMREADADAGFSFCARCGGSFDYAPTLCNCKEAT